MAELTLRVITPTKISIDTTVESVQLPLLDGSAGVLPGHTHMIAALDAGLVHFRTPGGPEQIMHIDGGFAEVDGRTVRVVCQAGETADEIDEERALAAEKRARDRIAHGQLPGNEPVDILRAQASLRRALMRQRVKRRS
jgi:F-type H+-transporting ATPase subunit epsilon